MTQFGCPVVFDITIRPSSLPAWAISLGEIRSIRPSWRVQRLRQV